MLEAMTSLYSAVPIPFWTALLGAITGSVVGGGIQIWFRRKDSIRTNLMDLQDALEELANWVVEMSVTPHPHPERVDALDVRSAQIAMRIQKILTRVKDEEVEELVKTLGTHSTQVVGARLAGDALTLNDLRDRLSKAYNVVVTDLGQRW